MLAAPEHYRNGHPVDVPDTGGLRGNLLAALTGMVEARRILRHRRGRRVLGAAGSASDSPPPPRCAT
ncbi:hypothetical protein [Actinomadura geliboluensis]|uniref:hypothetical protein n=1 Tax=Actinomadura geliboluensis TaxID=882440 RepID=UPI0036765C1D